MSRLEINVRRLLTRCELIAKDDPHKDWKLEKVLLQTIRLLFSLTSILLLFYSLYYQLTIALRQPYNNC